jgi:hypothetical protein
MKYCDTDLRPDLTLRRAELALKVCHATGRYWLRTGAKTAAPLESDVFADSLLADQTSVEVRSDNAVQFSKTTALLGAAGKNSTATRHRQPPPPQ